jgi:putative endonuclease
VDKQPAVYILASKRNGTLYVGVTMESAITREIRTGWWIGFSKRYDAWTMESAITREKRLKRVWKLELIESANPNWLDLYDTIV